MGFQSKSGVVWEKFLPAGLHAVEASYVSASALSAFPRCHGWGSLVL